MLRERRRTGGIIPGTHSFSPDIVALVYDGRVSTHARQMSLYVIDFRPSRPRRPRITVGVRSLNTAFRRNVLLFLTADNELHSFSSIRTHVVAVISQTLNLDRFAVRRTSKLAQRYRYNDCIRVCGRSLRRRISAPR